MHGKKNVHGSRSEQRIKASEIIVVFLMLITMMGFSCYGQETTETVRVAVINYPNYLQRNADGSVSGYAYEYLQDVQTQTGWQYEFLDMNFEEACNALSEGTIDLVAGSQYTKERGQLWDYSARNMGEGGTVLCTMPEDMRYSFNDYASYDGIRIASMKGSIRMEQLKSKLEEYGVTAQFTEYDTDQESKQALEEGVVDAVLMSSIRCETDYKILARINSSELFFCTNKKRPELKEQLDQAMEEIHLNNPYYEEQLDEKYYGNISVQLALSEEEKSYIASAGPIKVAVSTDLLPMEYYDADSGSYKGIVVDSLQLFSEDTGLAFEFVPREDQDTLMDQMAKGEVQVIASVADDPNIADSWKVSLTIPYYDNSVSLVAKERTGELDSQDNTVILRSGYPQLRQIAEAKGYHDFIYADTFTACVDAVRKGKADLTFIPANSAEHFLHSSYETGIISYILPDTNTDYCMGISDNADPLLVSILNKAAASLTKAQKSQMLIANMSSENTVMTVGDFLRYHRFGIAMIALAVMAVFTVGGSCFLPYI